MGKLIKEKLEQEFDLQNNKLQDLNSTEQERHPLGLTQLQRYQKVSKQFEYQNSKYLNSNCRVLRERKTLQISPTIIKKKISSVTPNMKRRVKKQGKYSSLETLTMRILKQKGIYDESKCLAKLNGIGTQKNYFIIALRLGYLYHYETMKMGRDKQRVIEQIYECLVKRLEECVNRKYLENNSDGFIELVKIKNMRDIYVFRKALQSNLKSFETVNFIIQELYEKKNDGSPSLKNEGFCQKVTQILIGTALWGFSFRLESHEKKIDFHDITDKIIEIKKYHEDPFIEQESHSFVRSEICIQRSDYFEDIFDIINPYNQNVFIGKQLSTVTNLQYCPFNS